MDYETNAVTLTVVAAPAPAVSDWGLAVMTVPITAGAVTIIRKRRFGME